MTEDRRPTHDGRWVVIFVFGPAILGILLLVLPVLLLVLGAPGPATVTLIVSVGLVALPALVASWARRRAALRDAEDISDRAATR